MLTNRKQCNIINLASSAKGLNANRETLFTGCGSAWLERLVWDQEVAGSNPVTPIHNIFCGCSSMVEHQPSKLDTWVRFPSPAFFMPDFNFILIYRCKYKKHYILSERRWSIVFSFFQYSIFCHISCYRFPILLIHIRTDPIRI